MSVEEIQAIGEWKTNADLIADAARLGYLGDADASVLDMTYERGTFWGRYRPKNLVTLDINPELPGVDYPGVDFRRTPFEDRSFYSVVFDPPYKLNGTPTHEVDARYGVAGAYTSRVDRHALMVDGLIEGARVLGDGYLLAKCADQVNGGRVRWQTRMLTEAAEDEGLDLVDSFLFRAGRPQPPGRRQEHARRGYSTLLVFTRRRRIPDYDGQLWVETKKGRFL